MNNIEKIKFGDQAFDLVPNGQKLGDNGGTITFQKGSASFDEIKAILIANQSIAQINLSGNPDWSRDDLVYAGKLTEQSDYVISTERVKIGVNEETNEPVYEVVDIKGDVMTAVFRVPDLREEIEALKKENAAMKKENTAIKETLGTLVISNLEEV